MKTTLHNLWRLAVTLFCVAIIGLAMAAPLACVVDSIQREQREEEYRQQIEKDIKTWRKAMDEEKKRRAWIKSEMDRIEGERR